LGHGDMETRGRRDKKTVSMSLRPCVVV
jgi:hypothetical protein